MKTIAKSDRRFLLNVQRKNHIKNLNANIM